MNTDKSAPWWMLPGLALVVLIIFAGVMAAAYATNQHDLSNTLSTGALNAMMLALGYFFGSSAGSAKKDDTIADTAAARAVSTPVTTTTTTAPVEPGMPPSTTTITAPEKTP